MTAAAEHPLRPMMVQQREALIVQARLYRRWCGAEGLDSGVLELFAELESNALQSIRSLEQWLGFTRPWTPE